MKSIHEAAVGRASPAAAKLPRRAAHPVARASCPAACLNPPAAKPTAAPRTPAPTRLHPRPPDPEFRAWLEELL